MKSLKQIKKEAYEYYSLCTQEACNIHPKLITSLQESDLADPRLFDDELIKKFEEINNKAKVFNEKIWNSAKEYFNFIAIDLYENDTDIGYYTDGEELNFPIQFSAYEPSVHLLKIYNVVMELKNYINLIPFWGREHSLYIRKTKSYIHLKPSRSPVSYIKNAKDLINGNRNITIVEQLIIAAKTDIQSNYELTNSSTINNFNHIKDIETYIQNVIEHKVLEELLKNEPCKEYIVDEVIFDSTGISVQLKEQKNVC